MRRERGRRAPCGRHGLRVALLAAAGALAVACGSASPGTFRPAGTIATGAVGAGAAAPEPAGLAAESVAWPPFGANVHIVMPAWLPPDSGEVPAVITAKDFLLAFLYAEYQGNQDDRWAGYVSGNVLTALKSTLAAAGRDDRVIHRDRQFLAHEGNP